MLAGVQLSNGETEPLTSFRLLLLIFFVPEIYEMTKPIFALLLLAVVGSQSLTHGSEFRDLVAKVPGEANAILAIDIPKVLSSELAVKNGWGQRIDDGSSPVYLPREADKVVVSAHMNPLRGFSRDWQIAVMGMSEHVPMRFIAKAERGYVDTVNGADAAFVPTGAYFVEHSEDVLGLISPPNRQALGHWVNRVRDNEGTKASEYLHEAVDRVRSGPQIVLAFDLTNASQPHLVQKKLEDSALVRKYKLNADVLAEEVLGIRGVSLDITLGSVANCRARIDFSSSVTIPPTAAKDLVVAGLKDLEAEIPGVEDFQFTVVGKAIVASGVLQDEALRRIMSILELHSTKFSSQKELIEPSEEVSGADATLIATQAYYKSITKMFNELEIRTKEAHNDAVWYERYADKIDRLPLLNVDKELVEFGRLFAQTLRYMANMGKGYSMQAGVNYAYQEANRSSGYGYGYGGYGYGYNSGAADQALQNQGRAMGIEAKNLRLSNHMQGIKLIKDELAKIRITLTDRYQVDF